MDASEPKPHTKNLRRDDFSLRDLLILVAGLSVAFVIARPLLLEGYSRDGHPLEIVPITLRVVITVLSGLSFVAVPLLLWRRRRSKFRWQPGQLSWFTHGIACWLLWPPIVVWQVRGDDEPPWSAVCWMWGTPLMGVYMTAALLAGGWLGPRARRRRRRSWSDRFGILLACLWACTGMYMLYLLYSVDLFRKR